MVVTRPPGRPRSVPATVTVTVRDRMFKKQSEAAAWYESRWTLRALLRTDHNLHELIQEQLSLFHEACLLGEDAEIVEQGEAMCRGWMAAVRRMEQSGEPDDAYLLGQHGGTVVAIGAQRAASARVRELHGDRVVWLTPDEVAAMFAGIQDVGKVKALWPDAEIVEVRNKLIDRYADEPAGD